jgi:eukaryotic-like serine/threonine-protein kinase
MSSTTALDPRFEVVDELGRGGMGIVYRARDRERGGEVALKALREVRPAELLRLKREFRVMCNVRHPNLVRLGELIERDGGWFFTMELVDGVDFLQWVGAPTATREIASLASDSSPATTAEPAAAAAAVKRGYLDEVTKTMTESPPIARPTPPPPQQRPAMRCDEARLRTALRGVADGLAGLHRAGLVHRDVKPSNIKIDANGRVVLLDFGVTVARDEVDGEIAGTYAYMAPEQATGQVTAAADWYAVGVMLFRALTGYFPFPASRTGLEMKASMPAPSPDEYVRDLPTDLVSLCRKLLASAPISRAGEADVRQVAGLLLPLRAPGPTIAPFVGRRRERAQLAALRDAQRIAGDSQVAVIIGSSGVGKTALARRFLDDQLVAEPQLMVLESRCDERETVPFNALDGIVDALARVIGRHPNRLPRTALEVLASEDAAELRRLFPVLGELASRTARRTTLALEDSRAAATRALRDVLTELGRARPLMLLIDDSQWADADSCVLLADLLAAPSPPLMVIMTARGPDAPPLARSCAVPVESIVLGGLDVDDAVELATAIAAKHPVDASAIAREAGGHPMFIAELSRFAAERRAGASSLDDALWARASDLSAPARRLLHVVVTDGAALPRTIAVAAASLAPEEASAAIAELRGVRLIRAGEDVVEPYHDRVREALVGRLPPADRAAHHRELARVLAAAEAPPERLAHHWAGCGERERAAQCAEAAATRAADALAFERASEWLAMALELGSHDDAHRRTLLIARGEALTHAGRTLDAGHAFLEAARTGAPSELELRDLRRRAAERLLVGGYCVEGLEVARELLAELGLRWPASRGGALRALAWNHVRIGLSALRWQPRDEAELAPEQKLRVDACWSAAVGLSMVDSMRGTVFAQRALIMALAAGEPRRIAFALAGAAFAAAGMNQQRRLRRLEQAIARAAADTHAPEARGYVSLAEAARAYFLDNNWAACRDISLRGLRLWRESGRGHTWEVDLFDQFIGWSLATRGDYREAADHADRVLRDARRRGDRFIEVGFRVQFPQRFLLDDQPDEGVRDVDDALASWVVPDGLEQVSNQFYWAWRSRTWLAIYAGRSEADSAFVEAGWRRIARSLLWKVPAVRIDVSIWAAAWTLARAAEAKRTGGSERRKHLANVRRHLIAIAASPLPAKAPWLVATRAVIAHLEGNDAKAIALLRAALPLLDADQLLGPAVAARWQLGRLLGGDEGAALIKDARAWLRSVKASDPERLIAWGLPGVMTDR